MPARATKRGPSLTESAEDWLAAKRVGRRLDDPGHADRARRADLRRWAGALAVVLGRADGEAPAGLDGWNRISVDELADADVVLRALDLLAGELAPSSRSRALSTLRGFCGWLVRRGLLTADPTDADEIRVANEARLDVAAFSAADVAAMVAAAEAPLPSARSAWPARDAAIVAVLADCGLRVSELCALSTTSIDDGGEVALIRVRQGAKGGKARNVPLPRRTLGRVQRYRSERDAVAPSAAIERRRPEPRLFVRRSGEALNQPFVDTLLRRLCRSGDVRYPDGAMAHALRHHYGAQLALRNVPVPVIQQLLGHADSRTTAIYTRAAEAALAGALDDAGWLT